MPVNGGLSVLSPYLRLLRPYQWVKSSFVFVGLLFGHAWADPVMVGRVITVAIAFSLVASAVYVINDLADRERDRLHPKKKHRPLASGAAKVTPALLLAGGCTLGGFMLAAQVSVPALLIVLGYLFLNLGYSFGLKHVAILDVFIIASGFMLRLLIGTWGVGIAPSEWLFLCGLLLTLFLGFAKRRAELGAMQGKAGHHRKVLDDYDIPLLDQMIAVCTGAAIVSYSLYTVSPDTVAQHGSKQLIITVPFVLYGMFRYLFLLHRKGGGGDPAAELLRDRHLLLAGLGWVVTVMGVLIKG